MAAAPLTTFLSKFKDWKYCLPSDNLWTVTILHAPQEGGAVVSPSGTIANLYSDILKANAIYNSAVHPLWNIKSFGEKKDEANFIFNAQDPEIGLFLANDISFNTNSITAQDSQSNLSYEHTGWLSFGKTITGRQHNHNVSIKFLKSNWDITELFIDRWIAAIGQQGLIEDSSLPNLRANIIISEYAASTPSNSKANTWVRKKVISLLRAFPKSRAQYSYSYDFEQAGLAKTNKVDFSFDAYRIYYEDIGKTNLQI